MPVQLLIPGSRIDPSSASGVARERSAFATPIEDSVLLGCVETVAAFNVARVSRAADAKAESVELNDDDVVELEFENGFKLYTSAAQYQEDMRRYAPQSISREGIAWRPIPLQAGAERGLKDFGERVLRVLRLKPDTFVETALNPSQWPAPVKQIAEKYAVKAGAWLTVRALTWLLESQLQPGPGLYRWPVDGGNPTLDFKRLEPITTLAATDKPLLVCIHGTASSTAGSFNRLFVRRETEGRCEPQPEWQRIQRMFGENIFAFEHRSLSQSPIENALQLAKALPKGATVRLLSHSRGGMVGDLLCLPTITEEMRQAFRRTTGGVVDPMDRFDQDQLEELAKELERKQFDVSHFARVACPARGTLLASESIERFLSGLASLIGLIPGVGTSVTYQVIKRVTLEVAKNRTNARWIPGIEAMVPDSPLVRMFNTIEGGAGDDAKPAAPPLRAKGKLGVIAGDSEGGGIGHLAVTKIADWFIYSGHDNDWVINTDSMYEGVPRKSDESHYVLDQGGDVSHFQYFANDRTREAVVDWLTNESGEPPRLFKPVVKEQEKHALPRAVRSATGSRPIVFVLPGVMGSGLRVGDNSIWCNYWKLAKGGLKELRDIDSAGVSATELLPDYYGNLVEFLDKSHEVIAFPYDWRQPIEESAKRLADKVDEKLKRTPQLPVRFIAHSMGGLVVRAMIQGKPDLWKELCDTRDTRLVMLGTPNNGSHAMVETLTGFDKLVRQLALLDVTQNVQSILDIVGGFPGVLELMPKDESLFQAQTWMNYRAANKQLGSIPVASRLSAAKSAVFGRNPEIPSPSRVAYVGGSAPRTVNGARIENNRLVLTTTERGDGRVTHESGRLPNVEMWFVDAEHGNLPNRVEAFEGYEELLHTGTTQRLSRVPIAARGGVAETITDPPLVLFPTPDDLIDSVQGRRSEKKVAQATTRPLRIEVVHGDLRYASYPVMAGHFEGDTISGPEEVLDRKLNGILAQRHRFGVYPGRVGTVYTALPKQTALDAQSQQRQGAVIIGLGGLEQLSPGVVANSIREGVLDYVLESAAQFGLGSNGESTRKGVGLSVLLIGSASASLMSVEDSVASILRGVASACREVERSQCPVVVDKIEIVELFADAAIDAARAVNRLAKAIGNEFEVRIQPAQRVKAVSGRRQRLWARPSNSAWRRWQITLIRSKPALQAVGELPPILRERLRECVRQLDCQDEKLYAQLLDMAFPAAEKSAERIKLRFVVLSDRSRVEKMTQRFQPELIDDMIRDSIQDTQYRSDLARILGTLLVPNDLKDNILNNSRLVLVVDEDTANYPWELMILSDQPLAIQLPLIRQLQTSRYRRRIQSSVGRFAYVVGEPKTSPEVAPLPAAKAEAQQVAALLQAKGYQVEARYESPTATQVLGGLFARPYRIVHLAGHGYYEESAASAAKGRCGMLLDNGKFLTAVEISKMSQIPQLVFLNCCYLGKQGSRTSAPFVPYNKLAASISRELIEMGVNAVIAAGWAVRDDAAELFAKTFYVAMLEGRTFGDAVREARQVVHAKFPDCNTWGAYQAYGKEDYRLSANLGDDPTTARTSNKDYFIAEEIIEELRSFCSEAKQLDESGATDLGRNRLRDTLGQIDARCPAEWKETRPEVLEAFGRAYSEISEFERASNYYHQALKTDSPDDGDSVEGTIHVKLIEQLANLEARWGARTKQPKRIEVAIERFTALLKFGETSERWALLGSAYKSLARVRGASKGERQKHLKSAADAYYRAWTRKPDNNYYSLNFLATRIASGHVPKMIEVPRKGTDDRQKMSILDYLGEVAGGAPPSEARFPTYWTAVEVPDSKVLALLIEFPMAPRHVEEAVHEIVELYLQAERKYGVTPRERDSALTQLKFLEECLPDRQKTKAIRDILARLTASSSSTGNEAASGRVATSSAPSRAAEKAPTKSSQKNRPNTAGNTSRKKRAAKET